MAANAMLTTFFVVCGIMQQIGVLILLVMKIKPNIFLGLTHEEHRQRQINFFNAWTATTEEFDEILQREIYLLEEMVELEKVTLPTYKAPGEDARLEQIREELKGIKMRLVNTAKRFWELDTQNPGGVWLLTQGMQSEDVRWKHSQYQCRLRFGCCARGCGCCMKPRRGPPGKEESVLRAYASHCTVECGCCIRWRGFRFPPVENGRTEKDV
ncbi:hypothetical protein ASPWEDRAFT_43432 [Aspergillus wentii DTO 134E9]|uniref:Uncharacterized protein n=1 Tax=Aspergillus wentii DTO 134E9 TaxID=1073089 RepID=A0A1L9REM6_ASPWE|nr:uncharacterized protein ASPWEDRAFT_43432 [Aspergillus wentii DTO 134E9]OJJ33365.1 hypothetical protein ASPWEDRAFT_43432 [Aspergillus wentii DTO 134E9]